MFIVPLVSVTSSWVKYRENVNTYLRIQGSRMARFEFTLKFLSYQEQMDTKSFDSIFYWTLRIILEAVQRKTLILNLLFKIPYNMEFRETWFVNKIIIYLWLCILLSFQVSWRFYEGLLLDFHGNHTMHTIGWWVRLRYLFWPVPINNLHNFDYVIRSLAGHTGKIILFDNYINAINAGTHVNAYLFYCCYFIRITH